jgi:hypothetical protein
VHKGVTKGTKDHTVPQSYTKPYPTIPFSNHTLYSREDPRPLITASSAIMIVVHFAKVSALYPRVVILSLHGRLGKAHFCHSLYFLWCMAQRSLHAITKVYYRSMSFFAMDSPVKTPAYSAKDSPVKGPSYSVWFRQITKYDTKNDVNPHSTEKDTQLIAFIIRKQAVPYWIRGGTCCPGGSPPKIRSLVNSSTTCHDSINHLHHSNRCSNHIIDPHTFNSHLDGWKTTTLSYDTINFHLCFNPDWSNQSRTIKDPDQKTMQDGSDTTTGIRVGYTNTTSTMSPKNTCE